MWRLTKLLFFLLIISFIGLVGYTYLGPYLGEDFSAPQKEIRVPVTLDTR